MDWDGKSMKVFENGVSDEMDFGTLNKGEKTDKGRSERRSLE